MCVHVCELRIRSRMRHGNAMMKKKKVRMKLKERWGWASRISCAIPHTQLIQETILYLCYQERDSSCAQYVQVYLHEGLVSKHYQPVLAPHCCLLLLWGGRGCAGGPDICQ